MPSSQQEEYRRLKQQIVQLEEQKKRCQQQQKLLPENVTHKKLASLSSTLKRTTVVNGSVKPLPKIVLANTNAEKKEGLQSSHISTRVGSDSRKIFISSDSTHIQGNVAVKETTQQLSPARAQESKVVKASDGPGLTAVAPNVAPTALIESPSHAVVSPGALLQKPTENISRTVCSAASLVQMRKEQQGGTSGKPEKLEGIIRKEEESLVGSKDGFHKVRDVNGQSAYKSDGLPSEGIDFDGSLEDKEAKLAQVEHQLLSKR